MRYRAKPILWLTTINQRQARSTLINLSLHHLALGSIRLLKRRLTRCASCAWPICPAVHSIGLAGMKPFFGARPGRSYLLSMHWIAANHKKGGTISMSASGKKLRLMKVKMAEALETQQRVSGTDLSARPRRQASPPSAAAPGDGSSRALAPSKSRIANFRRDSARRSYRSKARSCFISCTRMSENFSGPCGVAVTKCHHLSWYVGAVLQQLAQQRDFRPPTFCRFIKRLAQFIGQPPGSSEAGSSRFTPTEYPYCSAPACRRGRRSPGRRRRDCGSRAPRRIKRARQIKP